MRYVRSASYITIQIINNTNNTCHVTSISGVQSRYSLSFLSLVDASPPSALCSKSRPRIIHLTYTCTAHMPARCSTTCHVHAAQEHADAGGRSLFFSPLSFFSLFFLFSPPPSTWPARQIPIHGVNSLCNATAETIRALFSGWLYPIGSS